MSNYILWGIRRIIVGRKVHFPSHILKDYSDEKSIRNVARRHGWILHVKRRMYVIIYLRNLPSQKRVTSVRLSVLNKFKNVVDRLEPKPFHLRQNCCSRESMMPPLESTPWPSAPLSQPPSNGYLPSWSRSCPIARPATQKVGSLDYRPISLSLSS